MGRLDIPIRVGWKRSDDATTALGEQNTVGVLAGRTPAGPVTFPRISMRASKLS